MEAHTRSPRELFEGREHYEIPAFQRPYVWNEEDQWAPLWQDVVRVATACVHARMADPNAQVEAHHFLGAVVYASRPPVTGDVTRHEVIDGQQRMTTLQLLIDAVQVVLDERGHDDMSEALEDLVLNSSRKYAGKRERFKLWPSQADREAFERAMDNELPSTGDHQILAAHRFFRHEAEQWLVGKPDEDGDVPPGTEELRVEAISSTLQDRLMLVAIDLTGHDDAQLIFETLNDRGTPLLKADLIKNWLFRRGENLGADVESWADTLWAEFDTTWWREEIKQGRLVRSRIDIFIQYWLTMRRQEDLKAEDAFRVFVQYTTPLTADVASAQGLLKALRRDADTYRSFAQLDESTPEGRFFSRIIERLELAATTPVFLWMLSENHQVPAEQRATGLTALESWAIRRTLLRLTTKDVNKFIVSILKVLSSVDPSQAGETLVAHLSEQTTETRIWPGDDWLAKDLPELRMYGSLRQDRLRVVLSAVERYLRDQSLMYEQVQLPTGLEIEHIMPRGWRTYWDEKPPLGAELAAERDHLVNTLGNLTLITKSLNGSLSNRPWTDNEAETLKDGGFPAKGKQSLLDRFSLLVLNKRILQDHTASWTEADIAARSKELTQAVCMVWPGPVAEIQKNATQAAAAKPPGGLPELPWTYADIALLAEEAGETLLIVLDTLAKHPEQPWTNQQFKDAVLTDYAFAALGALTVKVKARFGRINQPVIYQQHGKTWTWSLPGEFAATWRTIRGLR